MKPGQLRFVNTHHETYSVAGMVELLQKDQTLWLQLAGAFQGATLPASDKAAVARVFRSSRLYHQYVGAAASPSGAEAGARATPPTATTTRVGRWQISYCQRPCKCAHTHVAMQRGQLRFTKHPNAGTRNFASHYSPIGMNAQLQSNPRLRRQLERPFLATTLPTWDKATVARVFSNSQQPAPPSPAIPQPTQAPWACPRCDQHFHLSIAQAKAHATEATCKAPAKPPPALRSRRTTTTMLSRLYGLLRDEPLIPDTPFLGCPRCKTIAAQCKQCRLFEALKIARNDPVLWDTIVYGEPAKSTAASRRRKSKHKKPEGNWVDPRLSQRDTLLSWSLTAAERLIVAGQP